MIWNRLTIILEDLRSAIAHLRGYVSFFGGKSCHKSRHRLEKDLKGGLKGRSCPIKTFFASLGPFVCPLTIGCGSTSIGLSC